MHSRTRLISSLLLFFTLFAVHAVSEREFIVAFSSSPIRLNPIYSYYSTEAQIYSAIYEGLVSYHPFTLEPVPAVAQSWDVSEDGATYTFHLRPTARFENGEQVTADDFRNAWLQIINPETDSAYNFLFDIIAGVREYRAGTITDPSEVGITATDKQTLTVTLRGPAPHFLRILAHHTFVPIHRSLVARERWEASEVIGNGPYRLLSANPSQIELERSTTYWDAKEVEIGRIRAIFDDDPERITRRFNRGEVDWVATGIDLSGVQFPETIIVHPLFATNYYFLRANTEGLSDQRVRRALALLLPWQEIRDEQFHYIPTATLVPQIPRYPEVTGITTRTTEEAQTLLAQAGFPAGEGLPPLRITIPEGSEPERVATLMQTAWQDALEVEVEIEVVPYPSYYQSLKRSEVTVGNVSWIGDFADPLTFLQMWITDSNANDAGFSNVRYDELIDQSMVAQGEARYQLLSQAEQLLLESGTVLPISHTPSVNLVNLREVEGWFPNPLDIHPFRYLRYSKRTPAPGVVNYPGGGPTPRYAFGSAPQ